MTYQRTTTLTRRFSTDPSRLEEVRQMNLYIQRYKLYRRLADRAASPALADYWTTYATTYKRLAYLAY